MKQTGSKRSGVSRKITGWIVGVSGTVVTTVVVSLLVPYIRDNLVSAWEVARDYLDYPVPAWSVAAAIAALLLVRWVYGRLRRRPDPDAELLTYRTDSFGPWHFHWTWTKDRFGRRAIRHLNAICSVHDLVLKKAGQELVCPKCHRTFPDLDHHALEHFRQTIARKAAARYGIEL